MAKNKAKTPSVIFFTRTYLQWWNSRTDAIVNYEFPADTVADLEVVNDEAIQQSLQKWLSQVQQGPGEVVMVLADDVLFMKDFEQITDKQVLEQTKQAFFDIVPFDNVLIKDFAISSATRLVGVNKGLYSPFVRTLEEQKVTLTSLFPQFIFDVDFSQGLTSEIGKSIASQLEKIADFDLIDRKKLKEKKQKEFFLKQFAVTKQVVAAIGFFIFLIGVLVVLIWNTSRQNQQPIAAPTPQPTPAEVAATATPVQPEEIASDEAEVASRSGELSENQLSEITIQVLNGSGISGLADQIKESLETAGFEEVETGNAPQANPSRTIVVVQPDLDSAVLDLLGEVLQEEVEDFSLQENSELESYSVVITLGEEGLL